MMGPKHRYLGLQFSTDSTKAKTEDGYAVALHDPNPE